MEEYRIYQIDELLTGLGLPTPQNYELYDQALTHSSYTYETRQSSLSNYERLEFLGDAVLKLLISEFLFEMFPHYREGDLTKIRAVIVSDAHLSKMAEQIHIGAYMVFGASEARSGGAKKSSNLACAFEALLGALFLDGALAEAREFLRHLLEEEIEKVDLSKTKHNFKAALQEFTQSHGDGLPVYRMVKETGPSHNRTFHIEVLVKHEVVGFGMGKSKKEAQQSAAKVALEVLNELDESDKGA